MDFDKMDFFKIVAVEHFCFFGEILKNYLFFLLWLLKSLKIFLKLAQITKIKRYFIQIFLDSPFSIIFNSMYLNL